jgi:hypothetical protein
MVRKSIRIPLDDQPPECSVIPPECRVIPFVINEIRARSERFSAARPRAYLPCRYWEEALQEDPADYPLLRSAT